jgi:hypothetical protein
MLNIPRCHDRDVHAGNVLLDGVGMMSRHSRALKVRLTDMGTAHVMEDLQNSAIGERAHFEFVEGVPVNGGRWA